MACLKRATPDGLTTKEATWPRLRPVLYSDFWARKSWELRTTTKPKRCRPSMSDCSTDNSHGASTTAGIPMARIGSTSSHGPISCSNTLRLPRLKGNAEIQCTETNDCSPKSCAEVPVVCKWRCRNDLIHACHLAFLLPHGPNRATAVARIT